MMLKELGIVVKSGICEIDGIKASNFDFDYAKNSEIFALDKDKEQFQKDAILVAKNEHDSVGGVALVNRITSYNVCYTKLLRSTF